MTEGKYNQYIADFNAACAGPGDFEPFFDKYFEPDAVFEFIPDAKKNVGKKEVLAFWQSVHDIALEEIQPHASFLATDTLVASEAPIDFKCKKEFELMGVKRQAGDSIRIRMAAFYELSQNDLMKYVRVYSIYNDAYQPK
jgi:hypothetical protein